MVCDAGILFSALASITAGLGGQIRWATPLFTFSLTRADHPLRICLALVAIKILLGLTQGIFAALAASRTPFLRYLFLLIHRLETTLRRLSVAHRTNLALSAVACLLLLAILEAYFRHFPHTLPHSLGNYVATGYDARPSGIYRYHPEMKMLLMRPRYERRMYFNGYYWTHTTDSLGFRNPIDRTSAYVILLGDSMIYGHGLEETSTVRHHLETILKKPVANLAAQGHSIHQEYQVLKTFGLRLKPAYVFLFFLANDISDLTVYLTDDEMRRLLTIPIADHSTPYVAIKQVRQRSPGLSFYLQDLYVYRAYQFLKKAARSFWRSRAAAVAAEWESRPPFRSDPRMVLAMRFHLHALLKMQHLAGEHRFRFINVFASREWGRRSGSMKRSWRLFAGSTASGSTAFGTRLSGRRSAGKNCSCPAMVTSPTAGPGSWQG
jgi:hypothetical protein